VRTHSWQRVTLAGGLGQPIPTAEVEGDDGTEKISEAARDLLEREFAARLKRECARAFEEGRDAALTTARAELRTHLDRLARSLEDLALCRSRYRKEAEHEVVRLAIEIARRILRRELTIDPKAILGLLHAAFESLALREVLEVRVYPPHAELVRASLRQMGAPESISVVGDGNLEAGAVMIETKRGGFDASAQTQIEEIERGFTDLIERGHE
jgi:flagellar assembly protein FliH